MVSGQAHIQRYVEVITPCAEDPHLMLSGLVKECFPNVFHFKRYYFPLLSPSFCPFPCEHCLFNSLPSVVCCSESLCKIKSYLGSPGFSVDPPGVALTALRSGISKCTVRHDLHSLLCSQKYCVNATIQIGWIRQVREANAEQ